MNPKFIIPAAVAALLAASAGAARAQELTTDDVEHLRHRVAPPRNAFELTLGTGYTEGFGVLAQGVGMPSVAQEGVALDLGLGYRINPHWMIGATGEYQELTAERSQGVRGVVAGIQAAYHIAPAQRLDPWVSLGTGYRWLWEVNETANTSLLTQGLEMGRLMVGLDVRASRAVAIAPVIGADLDTFLAQGNGGINNPGVSTFVHAGLMGRFDLGGSYDNEVVAVRRRETVDVGATELQPKAPAPPPPVVFVGPSVSVSSDIASSCGLKLANAAQFGFDDAVLTETDHIALDSIAACFTSGPLQGKRMHIIGHADPRGTSEYNMELGQNRADNVAQYLRQKGVEGDRMQPTSRGALDAIGHDEAGWASDRRVDISIAQ